MASIKIDLSVAGNSQACVECGKYEAIVYLDDRALCGDCETDSIAESAQAHFEQAYFG